MAFSYSRSISIAPLVCSGPRISERVANPLSVAEEESPSARKNALRELTGVRGEPLFTDRKAALPGCGRTHPAEVRQQGRCNWLLCPVTEAHPGHKPAGGRGQRGRRHGAARIQSTV